MNWKAQFRYNEDKERELIKFVTYLKEFHKVVVTHCYPSTTYYRINYVSTFGIEGHVNIHHGDVLFLSNDNTIYKSRPSQLQSIAA